AGMLYQLKKAWGRSEFRFLFLLLRNLIRQCEPVPLFLERASQRKYIWEGVVHRKPPFKRVAV
ncbi:MAG TPA: hypothetical protein PK529_13525, partial [Verrucomicrobiales bacterium]|nr:hypothetical protein [Verrucomicrobiales bacterium]